MITDTTLFQKHAGKLVVLVALTSDVRYSWIEIAQNSCSYVLAAELHIPK